jgi:hypothetical protein
MAVVVVELELRIPDAARASNRVSQMVTETPFRSRLLNDSMHPLLHGVPLVEVFQNGDVPLRPTTTAEAIVRSRRFPLSDYRFTG